MRKFAYFFLLVGAISINSFAQTSQTGMAYDTLGNRTQRVIAPDPNQLRTVASVEKERTDGKTPIDIVPAEDSKTFKLIPRKYIPSDYEQALLSGEIFNTKKHLPVYNQNQSDNDTSALKQSLGLRDASLPVASIPYNASVSPSGGRIYSVPIRTAAGFDYVPQISLNRLHSRPMRWRMRHLDL